MTRMIFEVVRFFSLAIWTVIGFVFWLPFLVRMIAMFIGAVLVSAGGGLNMNTASAGLDRAVRFYPEGFSKIDDSISQLVSGNMAPSRNWNPVEDFWYPLVEHIVFALLFWVMTLWGVYQITH